MILALVLAALQGGGPPIVTPLDSAIRVEERAGFSGVVLVARRDRILHEQLYGGVARLGVDPQDLAFWLASNSKQFTAAAVLRLQDMGRLRTSDSITRFFGSVPRDKRAVTVRQLLTHTAGLPSAYRADGIQERETAVAEIMTLTLVARPGAKFSYSNDGYTLLAAIVEIAAAMPFDRFVSDSVLSRARLAHTGLWGHESTRIAPVADPSRLRRIGPTIYADGQSVANWGYRGPTGTYATARDVWRWIRALQRGDIVSPLSFRALIGRHVLVSGDTAGRSYAGYGWGVRVEQGRDVSYGHVGSEDWLGHNGVIRFTPDSEIVVVLSNAGEINGMTWASRVNRVVRKVMDTRR